LKWTKTLVESSLDDFDYETVVSTTGGLLLLVQDVNLPDMRDTDIEVVIVYQTTLPKGVEAAPLPQFYGCIQDDSFIRHPRH
jgi:hypothetical protein